MGNEFGEKSLGIFGDALVSNKQAKLLILKMGNIKTSQQAFINFINVGFMTSPSLRYMYVTSAHYKDSVV